MNVLQTIKCKVGSHQWSQWKYVAQPQNGGVKASCEEERTCGSCQAHETRSEQPHSWQEWAYVADGSCTQERSCQHCLTKESRQAIHEWQEWEFKPGSCEQERECRRCHQKEAKKAVHEWGDWADSDVPSKQQRVCARCNTKEFKEAHTARFQRYSGSGLCDVCNAGIGPGQAYLVPVSVFYASRKYRD